IPKSGNRFPAFAKPASAGEARTDKIMRKQKLSRPPSRVTPPLPRLRARALGTPLGFRLRRRAGRRLVIDGLGRLSLDRLRHLVVFRHALFEGLYPLREIAHQVGQLPAAAE